MFADEVRQKIEKLRAMHLGLRLFAADHHRYEFNPPLAEIDLLRFEERNRISLPKDYRDFVLNVGNGGAGPYYGISFTAGQRSPRNVGRLSARCIRAFPTLQRLG
jgi:hypothetical protein